MTPKGDAPDGKSDRLQTITPETLRCITPELQLHQLLINCHTGVPHFTRNGRVSMSSIVSSDHLMIMLESYLFH